jgi:hypothetical protein
MLLASVENRVLNQSVTSDQTTISFYNSDIGAYLLSLARVRKLSRNTPSLQFNIAASGGQQVNVTK